MSELRRLELLRQLFARAPLGAGVEVGIGDDAAVLAPEAASLIWTVDAAVEGVHFRRDWMTLEDVGFRSLMAAVSDLAAMGARPRGVLSALILPADFSDEDLDRLAQGQAEAAIALNTTVIGGNLARGAELSITTTVLGASVRPLRRAGAMRGDTVAVAGDIGLAAAGLELLRRGARGPSEDPAVQSFRRPRARLDEGLAACLTAHAAIDISDGLVLDASRLGVESKMGIVLSEPLLRGAIVPALLDACAALALDPLPLALYGGEDYALFMTFPEGPLPAGFVQIGTCESGEGVHLDAVDGSRRRLEPHGFDHFAD